jgi:peptide/nickel transport system ATP-binding protein
VLVLHPGRIVERGPARQVLRQPQDPYTIQLLEAVPNPFVRPGNHVTR